MIQYMIEFFEIPSKHIVSSIEKHILSRNYHLENKEPSFAPPIQLLIRTLCINSTEASYMCDFQASLYSASSNHQLNLLLPPSNKALEVILPILNVLSRGFELITTFFFYHFFNLKYYFFNFKLRYILVDYKGI